MNHNLLVSIIVRTKDRPKLLKRAIQSIAGQSYRPIEVVLVNDGGCDLNIDELRNILSGIDLNYTRLEETMGRAYAGNAGIENAHGNYIGFLDDDDELYPDHVLAIVSFLEQSDYEVAYTDSLMAYRKYNPRTHDLYDSFDGEVVFSQDFNYDQLIFENYIPFMCLLFKRESLVTTGGFDTGLELYEDWDLLIRIGKHRPFYHLKQVTAVYNQWSIDRQISQRNRNLIFVQQAFEKVISKHIGEITPQRIHGMVSERVRNVQSLKYLTKEIESRVSERDTLAAAVKEKDGRVDALEQELKERVSERDTLAAAVKEKDGRVDALEQELKERVSERDTLAAAVEEKDGRVDALEQELKERVSERDALAAAVKEKDAQLNALVLLMSGKDEDIRFLQSALHDRDALITLMKNTRGWRMLEKYRRMRDNIFIPLFGLHNKKNEK